MPFPKGAKGKGETAAQDAHGLCGLCGRQVDTDEPWIEGECSGLRLRRRPCSAEAWDTNPPA